jgi:geranylgeranyl pyrophosphate synthase
VHCNFYTQDVFQYYLRKNYYKTGSLIANTVLSAAMLEGHSEEVQGIAFNYGVAVGQAFQLADDALDFEGSLQSMGKPSLADLKQGFATAPVLFAQEQFPELRAMIERKFSEPDDIDMAASMVKRSGSVERTRHLARAYSDIAIEGLLRLKPSAERDALAALAIKVANRTK